MCTAKSVLTFLKLNWLTETWELSVQ